MPSEATEHRTGGKRGVCARGWSLIPMAVGSSPASSQVGSLAARCDRTCSDWSAPGPSPCDRDLARRGWDSVKQVHLPNPPGLPGCLPSGAQGCRGPSPPHAPSSRAWGVNTGLCTSTNWHPLKVPSWTQGESCHLSSHPLSSRDAEKVALSSLRVKALLPLPIPSPPPRPAEFPGCPGWGRCEGLGGPLSVWPGPCPPCWEGKARSELDRGLELAAGLRGWWHLLGWPGQRPGGGAS